MPGSALSAPRPLTSAAPRVRRLTSSVAANPYRLAFTGLERCVPADPERALDRLGVRQSELET